MSLFLLHNVVYCTHFIYIYIYKLRNRDCRAIILSKTDQNLLALNIPSRIAWVTVKECSKLPFFPVDALRCFSWSVLPFILPYHCHLILPSHKNKKKSASSIYEFTMYPQITLPTMFVCYCLHPECTNRLCLAACAQGRLSCCICDLGLDCCEKSQTELGEASLGDFVPWLSDYTSFPALSPYWSKVAVVPAPDLPPCRTAAEPGPHHGPVPLSARSLPCNHQAGTLSVRGPPCVPWKDGPRYSLAVILF
uniref:Uncharacterized protein n=1 Tax=Apteryx owenii TaxID=8824 RepID=A0A8B9S9M5_APTOW